MDNLQAHPTKKGPGRKHGHKVAHGTPPKPPKGAFLGTHTNPKRNAERAAMKAYGGARAYKRAMRADKHAALPVGLVG